MEEIRIEGFTKEKINNNKKIFIYGAGRYGQLAYWGLKSIGITPDYFIDENRIGDTVLGVPVVGYEVINDHREDIILLASYNYYADMYKIARSMGANNIYNILPLLKLDYNTNVLSEYLLDEKNNYMKYQNVVENMLKSQLIINHCELVVTECCSLRCKDCANLMQYYDAPEHIKVEDIENTFDNFLDTIDGLLDMRILGGEPFVYPDLDKILNRYVNNEKIQRITLYTNSTIVPNTKVLEALCNSKVVVHMSNYGSVSRKVEELEKIFSESNIIHYKHDYEQWRDIGKIIKRNYNVEELVRLYQTCTMGKCYTFYRGKLYLCPRAAHGERLGLLKNSENEVLDFTTINDIEQKRHELYNLINNTKYITACDYCNGSREMSRAIKAAVQVGKNE